MARKKAAKQANRRQERGRRRFAGPAVLLALLLAAGFFGWMHFSASLIHLKRADVYLEDLPQTFEGTTLLYFSDLNIRNAADAAACARSMKELGALHPDLLVLGGDYTSPTLINMLNGDETGDSKYAQQFIATIGDFTAPMGKFAVLGEGDDAGQLADAFEKGGVQLLQDSCAAIEKEGKQLVIAGLSDVSAHATPYEEIGAYFTGDECVIALAHNPSAYIGIRVAEAREGGAWADMVLSGHTLGGQIKIGNRTLRSMPEEEARCIAGWYYGGDLPMLVSQGYGCRGAKLRLGTQSEVWLITLHKPSIENQYNLPLL